ncbi:unnamed protein product, partial [Iphiclides podalirius]
MLLECFNVVLSTDGSSNAICNMCIKSLRSSLCFKQQVLKADMDFIKWMREKSKNEGAQVKTDLEADTERAVSGNLNTRAAVGVAKALIKSPPKRRAKKRTKVEDEAANVSIATRVDKEEDTGSTLIVETVREATQKNAEPSTECDSPKRRVKKQRKEEDDKSPINPGADKAVAAKRCPRAGGDKPVAAKSCPRAGGDKPVAAKSCPRAGDKLKHRQNLLTILRHSNATPFKDKSLLGFVCGYCDSTHPDPEDLRVHTAQRHQLERLAFKSSFDMAEYSVKLDVTGLACALCQSPMPSLATFKRHLVAAHGLTIHEDIKDHVLEFRLSAGDVHRCALCPSAFETFKTLKQHMNRHYGNYPCNACHAAFATMRSLSAHRSTHLRGSFACNQCPKIFASGQKLRCHQRCQHAAAKRVANCPHCDAPFRSYYQRNRHLVRAHDAAATYRCNACDKAYILKSLLVAHVKRCHLLERDAQCAVCGRRFFSAKALRAHMVRHGGERRFGCAVCGKAYARKYTLREHTRIHEGDKRFKCPTCGAAFVQKCSLRSHLLSNHGVSVAASDISA